MYSLSGPTPFGSSILDIDVAGGVTPPGDAPLAADPKHEYVSSIDPYARERDWERDFFGAESRYRGAHGWHGVERYEEMYRTPAVGSSFNALRAAVLANGVNLLPAIKPAVGIAGPGQSQGTALEADMAAEICDSNKRLVDAWETPVDLLLWEHMEDMYLGHVLSEVVARDVVGGPDDGLLAIKAVRTKPRNSYRFRVDRAMNVIGIKAATFNDDDGSTEWRSFEPEHFAWSTWDPYRGDPRGRSCFRQAHYHWKMLVDLWPEVYKGWKQFGVPILYGTTAPGASMVPATAEDGQSAPGAGMTAERSMTLQMMRLRNGDVTAGPNGSDIKVVESTKDSSVVSGAVTILEAQIKVSIILAIRATTEAQHGSKADSETSQDVMGNLVRFIRKGRERFLRSILMRQNAWNYGDDIARRLTPLVDLGGTEHQDFAANSAGVGVLFQAGYFTNSQLPYVDTFLGLPQRQSGDQRVGPAGIMPDTPADPANPTATTPDAGQAPATAPAGGEAAT